jgi:hypothetical protein
MAGLRTSDMNMNMNMNMGAAGGVSLALSSRLRYNTTVFGKFAKSSVAASGLLVPERPYPNFHANWDADLRSYNYLQDFIEAHGNWRNILRERAVESGVPAQSMSRRYLEDQILSMLDLMPEREERFLEIIDQDDADGAVNYWLGMLKIDPARHPMTYLMVRVGRRIGEHVVMCLKGDFASPRPSQLCPALVPMIDPPVTPSFPAGHAVQAYLISCLLAYSLPRIPQQDTSFGLEKASGPLFDLADRVSENRVVAGLHYPTDIVAGKAVGAALFAMLSEVGSIWTDHDSLRFGVQAEFPQYAPR